MSIVKILGITPAKICGVETGKIAKILGVENGMGSAPGPDGWSGNIITAGSGKDYENFKSAWDAAGDSDMILVYGNHDLTNNSVSLGSKKIFVRGMGESPEDTVLSLTTESSLGALLWLANGASGIFENIKLFYNYSWDGKGVIRLSGAQDAIFNKCHIYYSATAFINDVYHTTADQSGSIIFRQCMLTRGVYHFKAINLAVVSMQKTEINGTLSNKSCTGSFAESDYVTTPTENYGYGYGEYLITSEFLASRGY